MIAIFSGYLSLFGEIIDDDGDGSSGERGGGRGRGKVLEREREIKRGYLSLFTSILDDDGDGLLSAPPAPSQFPCLGFFAKAEFGDAAFLYQRRRKWRRTEKSAGSSFLRISPSFTFRCRFDEAKKTAARFFECF